MKPIDRLLNKAFLHFSDYVSASEADAARYIHRTVRLNAGVLEPQREMRLFREVSDPFVFLTGKSSDLTFDFPDQDIAASPFVAMVVGSYGTGKTEMVYRLCEFLRANQAKASKPLPICLARCRAKRDILDREPSATDFFDLLHAGLPPEFDDAHFRPDIKNRIRTGEIMLILDGLDEFSQKRLRYKNFLTGLRKFLNDDKKDGDPARNYRVVITMRREYFTVVDTNDAQEALSHLLTPRSPCQLYLMEMNQYSDIEIEEYFHRRLDRGEQIFDKVSRSEKLFAVLRRPLLLKIFVDLIEDPTHGFDIDSLVKAVDNPPPGALSVKQARKSDPGNPTVPEKTHYGAGYLIEQYINHVHRRGEEGQRGLRTSYYWSKENLASQSVVLFRKGRSEFEKEDLIHIRQLLDYPKNETFLAPEVVDKNEDPFASVHKCPFLIRIGDKQVRFAHRAFFEFFTAKGITDVVKRLEGAENADDFNELVVNSDMRKFLQYFLGEAFFYDCIQVSCGLTSREGWNLTQNEYNSRLAKLGKALRILTEGMTYPETERKDVESQIDWFLKEAANPTRFHPGYLVYCFQAIATYIHQRTETTGYPEWRKKFEPILQNSFQHARQNRLSRSKKLNPWWERLIERILSVGLKLNYEWVWDRMKEREGWFDKDWQEDTKLRIKKIFEEINLKYSKIKSV